MVLATVCIVTLAAGGTAIHSTVAGAVGATEATADAQEDTGLSVENFSAPDEVRIGANFTVSADVVNGNDTEVVLRVTYQIAGNVIAAELVQVPANDAHTVEFDVTGNDTEGFPEGTFTHGVYAADANVTANLTLVADAEATTPEEAATTTPEATPEETPAEAETTTPAEEVTPTPEETPEATTASVTFEDQSSDGSDVTVDAVAVPEGGFVVVHDAGIFEGDVIGSIVGQSDYLEAGTTQNVSVELDEPLNESQRLVAVAYRDSNENRTFDFVTSNRTADGPYRQPGERIAVNDVANVTVETDEEQ